MHFAFEQNITVASNPKLPAWNYLKFQIRRRRFQEIIFEDKQKWFFSAETFIIFRDHGQATAFLQRTTFASCAFKGQKTRVSESRLNNRARNNYSIHPFTNESLSPSMTH